MKANKKKVIVLVAMVVLLVATGCLNYFLNVKGSANNANGSGGDGTVTPTFFASYRTDREMTRQQQLQLLDETIASATSSEEAIANAEAEKLNISKMMERELVLEGLIKAKGFEDCVVTMSTENVNIVVMDADLTQEDAAMIMYIIVEETGYQAPDIFVIPYV